MTDEVIEVIDVDVEVGFVPSTGSNLNEEVKAG